MKVLVLTRHKPSNAQQTTFIILAVALGAVLASSVANAERAIPLNYLRCMGKVPVRGWPPSRLRSRYTSMDDLCKVESPLPNIGCRCSTWDGVPECLERDGDSDLWAPGSVNLLSHCHLKCFCRDNPYTILGDEDIDEDIDESQPEDDMKDEARDRAGRKPALSTFPFLLPEPRPMVRVSGTSTCNKQCTRTYGCGDDGRCSCKAANIGMKKWRSGQCESNYIGKKRDDSESIFACPCNETYVSKSCCHARNGLVWERPEYNLGQLVLE
jgi:hypothetical protein